ncbi:MAG: VTT domain-containing protein [Candidatus Caccovivens sp.]
MANKKPLTTKSKIIRSSIVIAVIIAVLVLAYFILVWTGAWEYINSVDKIRELILSAGFWGRLAFVFIQFLQVTFLPIPSTISTLAGVLIYGPLEAALLSLAGIILGSVLAFALGRTFGRKLVVFMVGEESCKKWEKFLSNAKYSFFIMMVLPMFPDDVLCLVAGLTDMSWAFFVITNLVARPIGVFMTCYLGSGALIPYHGWGLVAWAFIVVIVAVLLFLSFKYRDNIENFLQTKFKSKAHKMKENLSNTDASTEQVAEKQEDNKEKDAPITKKNNEKDAPITKKNNEKDVKTNKNTQKPTK